MRSWRRDALRHLSLEYVEGGVAVELEAAPGLRLVGAAVRPRAGRDTSLWSTALDGGHRARFTVPVDAVGAAADPVFDEIVSRPRASGPTRAPVALLDLVLTVEADHEVGEVVAGRADYRTLRVHHAAVPPSRPLTVPGGELTPYLRRGGGVSLAYGRAEPRATVRAVLRSVRRSDSGWRLRGVIDSQSYLVDSAQLVLTARTTGEQVVVPVALDPSSTDERPTGPRRADFTASLAASDVLGVLARPAYLDADFVVRLRHHALPAQVPLRRVAKSLALRMPASVFSDGERAGEFRAYRTFKAGSLAFEFRPLAPDAVEAARHPVRTGFRLRRATRERPVWLVGERPETAQDTGVALYRYLREHHPEIDARYVIAADSPDRPVLGDDPGVVEFGSREHVEATLAAQRILSSHHVDYLMATRSHRFQRGVRARRVFLQHGVMGTKNMVANYGYDVPGFTADVFVVSSERERRMIVEDFGWPESRVVVTGLSRHDRLFEEHPPPQRRLLIMPTWRDWLRSAEDVASSEFLARWDEVLRSHEFWEFLERTGLAADLYLHANMQPYADLFDLSHVTVIRHGEVPIQDLLLRSCAMLTDYTSAGIDFSFLDRPVVYYQFDRPRFLGPRPSHFDLDEELPGDVVTTRAELQEALDAAAARGFTISPEARRKASALVAHRDTGARERIVEAARHAPRRRFTPERVRDARLAAGRLWTRASRRPAAVALRSRIGRPAFALASRLPRSGVVAFESNIGNDHGDSPGAIHRELVRRGLPVRTAWVVAPGTDAPEGSQALERLSIRYQWSMGRASAWITNQNMPALVPRPRATFYLQTWHGTPLKRMLHDLDTVVGRDAGYVGRVDRMIAGWSLLLSPSPWATERFRSAFRYEGDVLEAGYPRNDVLADGSTEERATVIRKRLGLARSKKVLLYAPTFRDDQRSGNQFTFTLPLDLDQLLEGVGDDYEVVVRLHPVVRGKVTLPWGVHNAGRGFEMEDLLATADVLVTDYSSVMFDFAVLERPMVFLVPDLEQYRDTLRGFYFDFEAEAPGPLVTTTAELVAAVSDEPGLRGHLPAVRAFRERFCPLDDGAAAGRVVDELQRRGVLPRG